MSGEGWGVFGVVGVVGVGSVEAGGGGIGCVGSLLYTDGRSLEGFSESGVSSSSLYCSLAGVPEKGRRFMATETLDVTLIGEKD